MEEADICIICNVAGQKASHEIKKGALERLVESSKKELTVNIRSLKNWPELTFTKAANLNTTMNLQSMQLLTQNRKSMNGKQILKSAVHFDFENFFCGNNCSYEAKSNFRLIRQYYYDYWKPTILWCNE